MTALDVDPVDRVAILAILADGPATFAAIERALHGPRPAVISRAHNDACMAITRALIRILPALVADGSIRRIEDGEIVLFAVPS